MGIPLQPLNIAGWAAAAQQANPMLAPMQIAQGLQRMRGSQRALQLKQQQMAQQQALAQQKLQQQAPLMQARTQLLQGQLSALPAQEALRAAQSAQIQQQLANPEGKPAISGESNIIESKQRIHVVTDFLNIDIDAVTDKFSDIYKIG